MKKVFLFAVMIAAFLGSVSDLVAQGPPPTPPPPDCSYTLTPSGLSVDSDDGFIKTPGGLEEIHFIITTSGQYRKYTVTKTRKLACGGSTSYITMNASAWYADRQSYNYGSNSSSYSAIPESQDWD